VNPDDASSGTPPTSTSGESYIHLVDGQPASNTTLYRCFNAAGDLLYVGITDNRVMRWRAHSRSKAWWPEVDRISVTDYKQRSEAEAAELQAIHTENPRHNVVGVKRQPIRTRPFIYPAREPATAIDPGNRDEMQRWCDEYLLDSAQAAELMGLSRPSSFATYAGRYPDWPPAIVDHGTYGKLYLRLDIEAFLARNPGVGRHRRAADDNPPT
jgi:hypothetical protein